MQGLDARADQLRHRRNHLPELSALEEEQRKRSALDGRLRDARMLLDDLSAELAKIDADVEQARARRTRDRERVDQGLISNPKDLQRMLHELDSLERRITTLEDQELEVMERLEEAQQTVDSLTTEVTATDERIAVLTASRDEKAAAIDRDLAAVAAERSPAVDELPADLLSLYDRLRDQKGGIGAAELRARQCGGCRLTLDAAELSTIRAASPDAVIRCEECQRILVRTAESGL